MSRRDDLHWLREQTKQAIQEVDASKRAPLVNALRGVLADLNELEQDTPGEGERSGLVDFQSELERRRKSASGSRRP